MANIAACLSSKRQDYRTPLDLYARLDAVHHFTHDAGCTAKNKLALYGITKRMDAFKVDWGPAGARVFCNPEYAQVAKWVYRGYIMAAQRTVVMLIPARTDTKWFHFIWDKPKIWVEVEFLKGRIKFRDQKSGAPFPSMVVSFRRRG